MRKERLFHSIRMIMQRSPKKKAQYLKKHDLLAGIGKDCKWGPGMLPLYTKLIKIHNNVYIHKTARLVPHDMINRFLGTVAPDKDFGAPERIGCIEIMDNVYVGMNAVILPNVRINRNCIISAGSVVTADVPENSIVAGNPARVVGRFDMYMASRLMNKDQNVKFTNQSLPQELADRKWKEFEAQRVRNEQAAGAAEKSAPVNAAAEKKILDILSGTIDGVDLAHANALVDDHILDSLGLITVVSLLEEGFGCTIPFDKINAHNFNSVRNMAAMVSELSGNTGTSEETAAGEYAPEFEPLPLDVKETEKPVVQRIFEHALRTPDEPAIIAEDRITTYSKLAGMIYSVNCWMRENGVGEGSCVTVQAIHDEICIAAYYAIHLAGAKLVPVEKSAASARIKEIASDTKSVMIISLAAGDQDIPWHTYDELRAVSSTKSFTADTEIAYPDIDLPCEMIFTTGTTGKSKGVLMTHRHISWYAYSVAKCIEMKKGNRFLLTTPLNHAGGLRRTHLTLANGCCMVYMDGMSDLGKYFEYIAKYKVTSLYLPPVAIRILLTRTGKELYKYHRQIDFVYSSSSPLPIGDCEKLRELLPDTRLYNAYEASETPGVSAYNYNTDDIIKDCLGKANEGVELAVLTDDGNITSEPGVDGQICVRSRMNMKEYYLEPELTKSVNKDGWFVSSDLGHMDENGNVYYSGRKGDVINIGGYKIAPTDVEEAALLSGLVNECICVEAKDDYGVPYIKLLVVVDDAAGFDPKPLNAFLTQRLEAYKIPRRIETVDSICRTFNGKIDRKAYR